MALPKDFYLNNWTILRQGAEGQFRATPDEIYRAAETRDQRVLRRHLRTQKNALFEAILRVGKNSPLAGGLGLTHIQLPSYDHNITQKDIEQCRNLLRTPYLLQCHTKQGDTPLHLACAVGGETVPLLLDMGADVTAKGPMGAAPLHLAALHGQVDAIRQLLGSRQVARSAINATSTLYSFLTP